MAIHLPLCSVGTPKRVTFAQAAHTFNELILKIVFIKKHFCNIWLFSYSSLFQKKIIEQIRHILLAQYYIVLSWALKRCRSCPEMKTKSLNIT